MSRVVLRFSEDAEADLIEIGLYTLNEWGDAQTGRYLDELERCCHRLADLPTLGRACNHVRKGLRRMECGKHVIFYRVGKDGVLISRILHQKMLAERQDFDSES